MSFLVAFNVIIDDIVFPDGRTAMGVLGGGGPQAAFGMKLWHDEVGLSAGVGPDLPASAQDWLDGMGIDAKGLRRLAHVPTLRAWQIMEQDGRRTQIWRLTEAQLGPQFRRDRRQLPVAYQQAAGFHIAVHPEAAELDVIAAYRAGGARICVETYRWADGKMTDAQIRALAGAGHIFSPNELEAASIVGPGEPHELARRLLDAEAPIVALRLGADGSLVATRAEGSDPVRMTHVPAISVPAVDPVGAGNAYCGAFLAGWLESGDPVHAGRCGAVAASFLVSQVGLPKPPIEPLRRTAQRRMTDLEKARTS